jgi:hypothetical protein
MSLIGLQLYAMEEKPDGPYRNAYAMSAGQLKVELRLSGTS